jgi:hypothetical protein
MTATGLLMASLKDLFTRNTNFVSSGLPDAIFPKNPNLGQFSRALEWKMFVYYLVIWNILRPFGIFHGNLVTLW